MYIPGIGESIKKLMNSEAYKAAQIMSKHQPRFVKISWVQSEAARQQASYLKAWADKIGP